MIMLKSYKKSHAPNGKSSKKEINRLLSAAVVNRKFCQLLLTNPQSALSQGYNGERFELEDEERQRVLSIRANTLAEFAAHFAGEH